MNKNSLDQLISKLESEATPFTAALSSPRSKESKLKKITIRPILLKDKVHYQISEQISEKIFHKNISKEACLDLICKSLNKDFKQGLIQTQDKTYHILSGKKQNVTIVEKPAKKTRVDLTHNRPKRYLLEEGTPISFLVTLGIMNTEGKVHANRRDKFKQINRFLEIVTDILPHFKGKQHISILDFGCGKAYLTFALYHYLHLICGFKIDITGLDLKEDVIVKCNDLAKKLGYSRLNFVLGDINTYQTKGKIDLMVTLHACDTATDAALEKAVLQQTEVILSVPCCQHELYSQVKNSDLLPLLQHGILKEKFAALATDAARGKILEALGYDVQIMEFIDPEHTPKNILIRAVRRDPCVIDKKAVEEYRAFKRLLNIHPSLEKRFTETLAKKEQDMQDQAG